MADVWAETAARDDHNKKQECQALGNDLCCVK
jgi:hypothetical protein